MSDAVFNLLLTVDMLECREHERVDICVVHTALYSYTRGFGHHRDVQKQGWVEDL